MATSMQQRLFRLGKNPYIFLYYNGQAFSFWGKPIYFLILEPPIATPPLNNGQAFRSGENPYIFLY